jgi:acetate kinase
MRYLIDHMIDLNTSILYAVFSLKLRVYINIYILAAQHVRQLVFTHRLGQRQASVVRLQY